MFQRTTWSIVLPGSEGSAVPSVEEGLALGGNGTRGVGQAVPLEGLEEDSILDLPWMGSNLCSTSEDVNRSCSLFAEELTLAHFPQVTDLLCAFVSTTCKEESQ